MNGGEGDDTLVWNNGDGSDVMNGDGGVDRIENNLGAGDDVSTLKPENGRARYDRTSPGAVQPEHRDARSSSSSTRSAATTRSRPPPGTGLPVVADGGAGNDNVQRPRGRARPLLRRLRHRHGHGRRQRHDAADVETVDAPARQRPAARAAGRTARSARPPRTRRAGARIKVSCPAGTSGCQGYVTLLYQGREIGRQASKLDWRPEQDLQRQGRAQAAHTPSGKPLTVKYRVSSRAAADEAEAQLQARLL